MKTLNVPLLAILLVSAVVLGGGVYALHRFQVRRNADVFLHQARRAMEEAEAIQGTGQSDLDRKQDRLITAARNYVWFVRLRPTDVDALEELGGLQMEVLQYPQALGTLERVVRLDPTRYEARRKLVDITLAFGRFEDAKSHLQFLLDRDAGDAELLEMLGMCQLMGGDTTDAVGTLEKAVGIDPSRVQAYRYLAVALRFRMNEEGRADEWIRQMIRDNPESLDARLLAGHYFQTVEAYDEAIEHAGKALELDPDNRDGLWLMAQCELGRDNRTAAREYAAEGIARHPDYVPMYAVAADVDLRDGQRPAAIARLQQGLDATQRDPLLLWYLGMLLTDVGQLERAAAVVAELQETDFSPPRVRYLDARVDFQRKRWLKAARTFERIRPELAPWPNLVKQADYWRGRSYQQLDDRTRAEAAFRSALSIDRNYTLARAALFDVMAAGGAMDQALGEFSQLVGADETTGAGMARLMIQRTLEAPPDQRDWTPVEQVLAQLQRTDPRSIDAVRLRAEMLVAQDRPREAEKLLDDARAKRPEELDLWLARATVAMRLERWEEADALLNEAQARFIDPPGLRLARARYLVGRYGRQAAGRLKPLAENVAQYDEPQRVQLLLGLAGAAQQIGAWDLFKSWAAELVEKQPDNLPLRISLFEQAMRDNDRAEMEQQLAAIGRLEGEGAQWLYGQAFLLTLAAEDQRDRRLDEALALLARAKEERPNWPRVPLLAAGIYERQGRPDKALDSYREAVDLGDRNPTAYRRLVQFLVQQGQLEEAQKRLRQFDELGGEASSELERLRGGLLASGGRLDEALEHARQFVANSNEYADHLWLGRLAVGKAQRERSEGNDQAVRQLMQEAEESFLRAVGISVDGPDAHLALIQLYAATDRPDLALAQVGQVERHVAAEQRPLVLAAAYELLGEPEKAEQHYRDAYAAHPANPALARALAEFCWRTNRVQEAEALARKIVDRDGIRSADEDRRWGRRLLARILTARGGYPNLVAATALIDENLKAGDNEADRRMKVALDHAHPSRQRREMAIGALEKMVAEQQEKAPGDVLGLAQLYLAADEWAKARPLLEELIAAHPGELRYAAILAEALLNRGETAEAQPYLDRLAAAAPNNFGTVSLQAEALFRNEQYDQAVELLEEFVDRPDAEPADAASRVRLIAGVLEQFTARLREANQDEWARRANDAAETLYRRYVAGQPEHELLLAAFLARQGRTVEALEMFERGWMTLNSANVAQLAAILLKSDAATEAHRRRTERIVERAVERDPDAVPLHILLAEARTTQQRYDEAAQHYRNVLKAAPDHAVALNNLAVLLALQGIQLDEAEHLINRAIAQAGPIASMLDSRATVYTALGQYDKALSDIERAIAENPSPVWLFHRALIHDRAGRKQAAAKSLAEAHRNGLTADMLQPLEHPDYERMQQELAP